MLQRAAARLDTLWKREQEGRGRFRGAAAGSNFGPFAPLKKLSEVENHT